MTRSKWEFQLIWSNITSISFFPFFSCFIALARALAQLRSVEYNFLSWIRVEFYQTNFLHLLEIWFFTLFSIYVLKHGLIFNFLHFIHFLLSYKIDWKYISFWCIANWFRHINRNRCVYVFLLILFPYRLLQNIEYSFLRYAVGPCCFSILCKVVYIYINPKLLIYLSPAFPIGNNSKFILYVYGCISVL